MRQAPIKLTINNNSIVGNTMASSFSTDAVNLISAYAYSVQIVWSGSPTGSFSLQASNDPGDNGSGQGVSQPTHFTTLTSPASISTSGTTSILFDVPACSYRWVRVVYTSSSSSGSIISAYIDVKGV